MAAKPQHNIWIKRQQCPCGDWKCNIKYEGDNQGSLTPQSTRIEPSSSSSQEVEFSPYVGQIFKTDNEAFEYYSNFAFKNGFSIRKARSTESQNLGVYRRDFVCHRSGFNQPRKKANVEHPRDRKSARCGCDAKLYLTKEIINGVSRWYISQFSNVHNHELLGDEQVRLLPAYRKIEEPDQERILLLSRAGFPVNRIVKVLEMEKGVQPGQLPFIEKDVRNFVRSCRKTVEENDAMLGTKLDNDLAELLDACKVEAERNEGFVYDFSTDDGGKVENIAWAYGDSARLFSIFGDVVTFDTSYCSVASGLVLGVWFGINNHGRPIFFGCTLLRDETSKSFSWALQVFVGFMRGRQPEIAVTDMDLGLRDAIAIEMPNTKQIIPIRHVLSKISSWFSMPLGEQYRNFKSAFDILCRLENVEDFEHRWNHLVDQFGIGPDKHTSLLFDFRKSWPFCHVRNYFLARALTPEYCESIDTILKNIVSAESSLVCLFNKVSTAAKIGSKDRGKISYLPIKTCMPLEEHARASLTPFAFAAFQHEIVESMQYAVAEIPNGSYLVSHHKKMERECLVILIHGDERVHCSCKGFEHSGILCRHSLRVLAVKNYFQVPEKYLQLRWRPESEDPTIVSNTGDECSRTFHSHAAKLYSESMLSKERFDFVIGKLERLIEDVRTMAVSEHNW